MSRLVLAVAVVVLAALPAAAQTPVAPPPPVIVTQGEATVKRAPDQAWLSVATETRDVRAEDARRKNAEATAAVQTALRGAGLAADAIRTTGYSLMPDLEWNNGRSTLKGYIVRNQIDVRVDDLTRLGTVVDAANATRSTSLTITGPRFALKDPQAAENEALRLAVGVALARGQALAVGAKRTLGNVIRIEDQNAGGGFRPEPFAMRTMAKAADAAETPITPGEIEVRAVVIVTFDLR